MKVKRANSDVDLNEDDFRPLGENSGEDDDDDSDEDEDNDDDSIDGPSD